MIQKLTLKKDQKGFTLIELMIVIAIIGILAAIAIPQFAAYRQKSQNSAAMSDVRNCVVSQADFMDDWQVFGYSFNAAAGNAAVGAAAAFVAGPGNNTTVLTSASNILQVGISNRVTMYCQTDAAGSTYIIEAKHTLANESYGSDAESSAIYVYPRIVGGNTATNLHNTPGTDLNTAAMLAPAAGVQFGAPWAAQ